MKEPERGRPTVSYKNTDDPENFEAVVLRHLVLEGDFLKCTNR